MRERESVMLLAMLRMAAFLFSPDGAIVFSRQRRLPDPKKCHRFMGEAPKQRQRQWDRGL